MLETSPDKKNIHELRLNGTNFAATKTESGLIVARSTDAMADKATEFTQGGVLLPRGVEDKREFIYKEKVAKELAQQVKHLLISGTDESMNGKKGSFLKKLFGGLNRTKSTTYYTRDTANPDTFITADKNLILKDFGPIDMKAIWSLYINSHGGVLPNEGSIRFVEHPLNQVLDKEKQILRLAISLPRAIDNNSPAAKEKAMQQGVEYDFLIFDFFAYQVRDLIDQVIHDPSFLNIFIREITASTNPQFADRYGEVKTVLVGNKPSWDSITIAKDPQRSGTNPLYDYSIEDFIISDGVKAFVPNKPKEVLSYHQAEDFAPKEVRVPNAKLREFNISLSNESLHFAE